MRPALLLTCSLLVLAGCSDKRAAASRDPQEAATQGRDVFESLVDEQTYEGFGFDSLKEVKDAELGRPMAVFYVPPDRLRDFYAGQDAAGLLVRSPEAIYPLSVNGQVRSSITVVQTGEEAYRAAGFGDGLLVKRLSSYRSNDASDEFVVHVLGLHMYFLGGTGQEGFTLTPIEDDGRIELRAGHRYEADVVLQRLGQIARELYPEPTTQEPTSPDPTSPDPTRPDPTRPEPPSSPQVH
jgi:hypothetical protein